MRRKIFGKHLGFSEAVATLTGTIIGAGVLAIPYSMKKAGFLTGLLNLAILSIVVLFLFLFVGEIVLRTKGNHQLTGYAEKYLGKKGKLFLMFAMVFGTYGALVAYTIGVGRSLVSLFGIGEIVDLLNISVPSDLLFSLLFFLFCSTLVYLGLNAIRTSELFMASITVIIIIAISLLVFTNVDASNLTGFNFNSILIPFGVILFALGGTVAVPEMKRELEILGNKKEALKMMKKAIIVGVMIPIVMYFIFSLVTIGVCGKDTTEVATICLGDKFGFIVFLLGNLFAIFAMSTSFLTLGLGLKEMYNYDYNINKNLSALFTLSVPLIIFLMMYFFMEKEIFFRTIGITGGIAASLESILIVLMYGKAKISGDRKREYEIRIGNSKLLSVFLIIIFIIGMIYTIIEFLGFL